MAKELPPHLLLRALQRNDYNKGYIQLLSQLTNVGHVTKEMFEHTFDNKISTNKTILVLEDKNINQVIASESLLFE